MNNWYSRPIFFVKDPKKSIEFYVGQLGFEEIWAHKENDEVIVAQVSKNGFEIILNKDAERAGKGRAFISLDDEQTQSFKGEIAGKGLGHDKSWGMPVTEILDIDNNELLFSPPVVDQK